MRPGRAGQTTWSDHECPPTLHSADQPISDQSVYGLPDRATGYAVLLNQGRFAGKPRPVPVLARRYLPPHDLRQLPPYRSLALVVDGHPSTMGGLAMLVA